MKLHTNRAVIDPGTLSLLKKLQEDSRLDAFFLVGGTALALQIGHRLSVDLDFFTGKPFETAPLIEHLSRNYDLNLSAQSENTVLGFVDSIKVDFIAHTYALVNPLIEQDGLRLASMSDIGAMKLNAIVNSGERIKDFIDVFHLLEIYSLKSLLEAYRVKYPHSNPVIALKAVSYFEDVDEAIDPPIMTNPLPFGTVKKRILEAVDSPEKIFGK